MAQLGYTRLMTPRSYPKAGLSGTHVCIPACPNKGVHLHLSVSQWGGSSVYLHSSRSQQGGRGRDRTVSRSWQHSEPGLCSGKNTLS